MTSTSAVWSPALKVVRSDDFKVRLKAVCSIGGCIVVVVVVVVVLFQVASLVATTVAVEFFYPLSVLPV